MPSSSSPAADWSGSARAAGCGVPQPAEQLPALRVDDAHRVGQPGRRGRDQLEVKFRQVGPGPADLGEPVGHPVPSGGGQGVHFPVRPVGQAADCSDVTTPAFSSRVRVT